MSKAEISGLKLGFHAQDWYFIFKWGLKLKFLSWTWNFSFKTEVHVVKPENFRLKTEIWASKLKCPLKPEIWGLKLEF